MQYAANVDNQTGLPDQSINQSINQSIRAEIETRAEREKDTEKIIVNIE